LIDKNECCIMTLIYEMKNNLEQPGVLCACSCNNNVSSKPLQSFENPYSAYFFLSFVQKQLAFRHRSLKTDFKSST
jgi:hypothetical protein